MERETRKSYLNLVRHYFPQADQETCEFILWELTGYPCCSREHLKKQLKEAKVNVIAYGEGELSDIVRELAAS